MDGVSAELENKLHPKRRLSQSDLINKGIMKSVIESKGQDLKRQNIANKLDGFIGDERLTPEELAASKKAAPAEEEDLSPKGRKPPPPVAKKGPPPVAKKLPPKPDEHVTAAASEPVAAEPEVAHVVEPAAAPAEETKPKFKLPPGAVPMGGMPGMGMPMPPGGFRGLKKATPAAEESKPAESSAAAPATEAAPATSEEKPAAEEPKAKPFKLPPGAVPMGGMPGMGMPMPPGGFRGLKKTTPAAEESKPVEKAAEHAEGAQPAADPSTTEEKPAEEAKAKPFKLPPGAVAMGGMPPGGMNFKANLKPSGGAAPWKKAAPAEAATKVEPEVKAKVEEPAVVAVEPVVAAAEPVVVAAETLVAADPVKEVEVVSTKAERKPSITEDSKVERRVSVKEEPKQASNVEERKPSLKDDEKPEGVARRKSVKELAQEVEENKKIAAAAEEEKRIAKRNSFRLVTAVEGGEASTVEVKPDEKIEAATPITAHAPLPGKMKNNAFLAGLNAKLGAGAPPVVQKSMHGGSDESSPDHNAEKPAEGASHEEEHHETEGGGASDLHSMTASRPVNKNRKKARPTKKSNEDIEEFHKPVEKLEIPHDTPAVAAIATPTNVVVESPTAAPERRKSIENPPIAADPEKVSIVAEAIRRASLLNVASLPRAEAPAAVEDPAPAPVLAASEPATTRRSSATAVTAAPTPAPVSTPVVVAASARSPSPVMDNSAVIAQVKSIVNSKLQTSGSLQQNVAAAIDALLDEEEKLPPTLTPEAVEKLEVLQRSFIREAYARRRMEEVNNIVKADLNALMAKISATAEDDSETPENLYITPADALNDSTVYLTGILKKEGKLVKSWKQRFFVLAGGRIDYYDSQADYSQHDNPKPNGTINLNDAKFDGVRPDRGLDWPCMELKDLANNRIWHFAANNDMQNQIWQNRILSKLNELKYIAAKKEDSLTDQKILADKANAEKSMFAATRRAEDLPQSRNVDTKILEFLRTPTNLAIGTDGLQPLPRFRYDNGNIDFHGAVALGEAIKVHVYLVELSLRNSLDKTGLLSICSSLGANKSLLKLDLSLNKFSSAALSELVESMQRNTSIVSIRLEACDFEDKDIPDICKLFEGHKFETIELQKNKFGDDNVKKIARSIHGCKGLRELTLSQCDVSDKGAQALSEQLADKPISRLDLSNNNIGDSGAVTLAKVLTRHQHIHMLNLQDNMGIKGEGRAALSHLCQRSMCIREIHFGEFHLTSEAIASMRLLHLYGIATAEAVTSPTSK